MITSKEELGAWLRLSLTHGVGNETMRRLMAAFGMPEAVFTQSSSSLRQVVSAAQALALQQEPDGWQTLLDDTWEWLQTPAGLHVKRAIVTLGDNDYPSALLEMPDPPMMLYVLGQTDWLSKLEATSCIAVVGSRNPTPQGEQNAKAFAQALSSAGLTVVSGMALGVDGAAHEGALSGAAPEALATIAVVGTGLDRVYPKHHLQLAHQIAQRGLILSEYPLGTPPLNANFPKRNRIISGLSQATLVVEAALKSGSLITAKQALEQGKEVLAIPGSIHSTQSKGCHALIKQGAKLVESAQDVLEELRVPDPFKSNPNPATDEDESAVTPEAHLLTCMGFDPVGLDALQARCGLDTASLQTQLLTLELEGQIGRLPGGLFQRMAKA
jgi:DNA processing protein